MKNVGLYNVLKRILWQKIGIFSTTVFRQEISTQPRLELLKSFTTSDAIEHTMSQDKIDFEMQNETAGIHETNSDAVKHTKSQNTNLYILIYNF